MLPALLLLGMRGEGVAQVEAPPVAGGSGDHAWWVTRDGEAWVVQHAAREAVREAPLRREVARFADQPVAIACEQAVAWIFFRSANGRSEVLAFEANLNPVSGLWFSVPPAGRLFASLPVERIDSVAAIDGEPWAIEAGAARAWRLRGERWVEAALPTAAATGKDRQLFSQGDSLWCLARTNDGSTRRWRLEGEAWSEAPLQAGPWNAVVPGAARLTLLGDDRAWPVQAAVADRGAAVTPGCSVVGWGEGLLAIRTAEGGSQAGVAASPSGSFGPFFVLQVQRSVAVRWYHLPLLGVLSLGALMLAGSARMIRSAPTTPEPPPMPPGRRLIALVIDLAPMGAASVLVFDASIGSLFRVPLWTTDIADSVPFMAMVAGATLFGVIEECAGSRSLGKRLMGGCVLRRDGARAGWIRHAARNLLKALVLLSPVLALPAVSRRRHEGIPETVTGTMVTMG